MARFELEERVYNWIEKRNLIPKGEGVLIGLSGGADSVALFRFFCNAASKAQWTLRCVHVEHGLRGQDSLKDAAFVEKLCGEWGVSCRVVSVGDVIAAMDDTHMSLEEKARSARYDVLMQQAERMEKEIGEPVHIALAHHANDNAETMLFHLARGTGIDGMRGMPIARGPIVRPFLQVSRQEIEDYLKELKQDYCQDVTNGDVSYDRNRIRHHVMPELEKVNNRAVEHMTQAAELLSEVAEYVQMQAEDVLQKAKTEDGKELSKEALLGIPDFLQREVIHLWLQQFVPGAKDIGASHIYKITELLKAQVGREYHLPRGVVVARSYVGLAIGCRKQEMPSAPREVVLSADEIGEETIEISYGNKRIFLSAEGWDGTKEIPENLYTKCFDYDMIRNNVSIRGRRSGDYITITAEGTRKRLQDYFVNEKVPAEKRDGVPLLCDDSHVIWVMGYRISEHYKISEKTKKVLRVHMIEEKEHE